MKRGPDGDLAGAQPSKMAREDAPMQRARSLQASAPKYPVILYKDTEPLQNVQNYWRSGAGDMLEVLIPPDYMTKENKRVKARQIWGDLVYSPDSDIVAVLMHLGFYAYNLTAPPPAVVEVRALIKLLPPRGTYPSKARFLKSREWVGNPDKPEESCSYQVERCWLVTRSAQFVELPPCIDDLPAAQATVQPQFNDRQITTRNTGNVKSKQCQEVSVQFNLCNEPWLKYSLAAIADKGMKPSQLTSARLLTSVLFVETHRNRYQIALQTPAAGDAKLEGKDLYTFSRCKSPLPTGLMHKLGIPLPADQVEVYLEDLEWEEFKWGIDLLHLRGTEYALKRMNFLPLMKPEVKEEVKVEETPAPAS